MEGRKKEKITKKNHNRKNQQRFAADRHLKIQTVEKSFPIERGKYKGFKKI